MNINENNERNGTLIKNNPSVHNDVQRERKRVIEGAREKRREKKHFKKSRGIPISTCKRNDRLFKKLLFCKAK